MASKIQSMEEMKKLVTAFYCVTVSAHVQHENTRSFAAHKALGEFYDFTSEFKDRLIEYMIGQGYISQVKLNMIDGNEDVIEEATDALDMLMSYYEMCEDETLGNMAADFQEAIGKLKYLLLFK